MEDSSRRTQIVFDGLAAHVLGGIGTAAGRQALATQIQVLAGAQSRDVELIDHYEKMVASTDRPANGLLKRLNTAYEKADLLLLNVINVKLAALGADLLPAKSEAASHGMAVAESLRIARDKLIESLVTQVRDKAPESSRQEFLDSDFVDSIMKLYDALMQKTINDGVARDVFEAKRYWTYRGTYLAYAHHGHLSEKLAVHLKAGSEDRWIFYRWRGDRNVAAVMEQPDVEHSELSRLGFDVIVVNEQNTLDSARLRDTAVLAHYRDRELEMLDLESAFSQPDAESGLGRNIA